MPKKFIEKYMPNPEELKNHKYLKVFGNLLHKPNLWALNRKSAPGAFAIGLFAAWVPIPFQMILAAALAIFFNVNLPVSVALVWLTNPVTMPFMFYAAYLLGAKIMGRPEQEFHFEASWAWVESSLSTIGLPFLVGCGVLAVVSAIVGYFVMSNLWKYNVLFKWNKRGKYK
ncbi:DUF2062 domain-containing protein [Shewanella sp. WXL01]|uniref:DUF2062 domain-containing protein n=1 Tax=Shewanella sp. WXL01 TaxID=2709721 RepID=UPI0014385537|nr:DUF2062 domain-containing protein [Shewanella sp. WXL01]NKF52432.1 DUF2062 domain-containing protein [Shewanella sp. WXL01]